MNQEALGMSPWRWQAAHGIAELFFHRLRFPGSRKLARSVTRALLPRLRQPMQVPTRYGFSLWIHPRWAPELYYLGFYESGTLHVLKNYLQPGDVFVDVGANVGLMTVYAARLVGPSGKVIAFEPVPELFDLLHRSIGSNQLTNVEVVRAAVGPQSGRLHLDVSGACPSATDRMSNDTIAVAMISLDDYLEKACNVNRVKLLKVDVEGFEASVIRGACHLLQSKQAPLVCLEYSPKNCGSSLAAQEPLRQLMTLNDYRFFQLKGTKAVGRRLVERSLSQLVEEDNVFALLPQHVASLSRKLFA